MCETRRLHAADALLAFEAIRTIKEVEVSTSFTVAYLEAFLTRPDNILIVVSDGPTPVGFLLAYRLGRVDRDQPMICLYEVGVLETHQRQGIGRVMIERLKDMARQMDAMEIWVITNRSNVAAMRLYQNTGAVVDSEGDEVVLVYKPVSWDNISIS